MRKIRKIRKSGNSESSIVKNKMGSCVSTTKVTPTTVVISHVASIVNIKHDIVRMRGKTDSWNDIPHSKLSNIRFVSDRKLTQLRQTASAPNFSRQTCEYSRTLPIVG